MLNKIANPELRKVMDEAEKVDAELVLKLITVVDSTLGVIQRNNSNDNAVLTRRVISVEDSIQSLRSELIMEREARTKAELEAAQRAVDNAKARLKLTTDARIELQKIAHDAVTESVGDVLEDKEEKEREEKSKWWRDSWLAVARAGMIAVAIPVVLGLVAAIILFLATIFKVPL